MTSCCHHSPSTGESETFKVPHCIVGSAPRGTKGCLTCPFLMAALGLYTGGRIYFQRIWKKLDKNSLATVVFRETPGL